MDAETLKQALAEFREQVTTMQVVVGVNPRNGHQTVALAGPSTAVRAFRKWITLELKEPIGTPEPVAAEVPVQAPEVAAEPAEVRPPESRRQQVAPAIATS